MMKIKTERDPLGGDDAFKLTGTIGYSDIGRETAARIYTEAERKSEAIEVAIKEIDALIEHLEQSKSLLGDL